MPRGGSAPAEPRPAVDGDPAARRATGTAGLPAPAAASMAFAAGMSRVPGRPGRPVATPTVADSWSGPTPAVVRVPARLLRRDRPPRLSRPPYGRRSRSPACCWPGRPRDSVVADTTGRTGRPTGWRWRPRARRSPTSCTGAGWCCGPTCSALWAHWITPEFEPRRYDTRFFVAALPAGPAHPGRVRRVRPGRLDAPGRRVAGCRRRRDADAAADVPVLRASSLDIRTVADVLAAAGTGR